MAESDSVNRETLIRGGFVLVLVLGLVFHVSPWADWLNGRLLDQQFRALRALGPKPAASQLTVVGIDEATFEEFPEPMALWHEYLGRFLTAMKQAGPATLALDVVLPEHSYDFLAPGHDRALLAGLLSLKDSVPVFLGQTVDAHGNLRRIYSPVVSLVGPEAVGLVLVQPDEDGTIRGYQRVQFFGEEPKQTLVAVMARRLGLDMPEEGLVDFSVGERMEYVPLQKVLALFDNDDERALTRMFASRHVFLGAVLPFEDRHPVPVTLARWEPDRRNVPGVLVHAQALRSLQADGFIAPAASWTGFVGLFLGALLWWLGSRPVPGVAAALLGLTAVASASTWWLWNGTAFTLAGVLVVAPGALAARMALEGGLAFRERRRLRRSFGRYVSPHVLREILNGRLKPEPGGKRCRVCVLFADIRNFTTRSEAQPPEYSITLLNRYFELMTRAIHRYDGTIGTFMGDGIFAFYGAPRASGNPSRPAFMTAQRMLRDLAALNGQLVQEGTEPIETGIGLHTGEVVVGHVGSRTRNEYTVIGDTVNTAARLEGVTKTIGFAVALSDATAGDLGNEWPVVDCGPQPIKGRADVRVFGWRLEDGERS